MGLHSNTVFKNSCLKVPLNPDNKLPLAKYERISTRRSKINHDQKKMSFDSTYSDNATIDNTNLLSFREFYKSIPDYDDVNHMTNTEFYRTLESLKENKNKLLLRCGKRNENKNYTEETVKDGSKIDKYISTGNLKDYERQYSASKEYKATNFADANDSVEKLKLKLPRRKDRTLLSDTDSPVSFENTHKKNKYRSKLDDFNVVDNVKHVKTVDRTINDILLDKYRKEVITPRYYVDNSDIYTKDDTSITGDTKDVEFVLDDNYFKKSYSLPTSPVKRKKFDAVEAFLSSPKQIKNDEKLSANLFKDRANLENKFITSAASSNEQKLFRANPVPIESRIPLYDKIMEDQELRRSISKLQSTAELQSQMKPFTFTEREERQNNLSKCYRLCRSNPQLDVSSPVIESNCIAKHFKAKPVPKNLFSNYVFEKMREDDFYRALNRRIRAEEMLKASSLPPSMAKREKKKDSSLSISPITLQPSVHSGEKNSSLSSSSSKESGKTSGKKGRRRSRGGSAKKKDRLEREYQQLKREFIYGESPRKANSWNNEDLAKKVYSTNRTSSSGNSLRVQSASDIPSVNRSNLAAILRMEATKRKLEADMLKVLEEERYQSEVKWRDSVLRRKPAWNSIKYSHSHELSMRLQTRKEEERLRREQFLHEMETMYGRVHQQPLMFERIYGPRHHRRHRESVTDQLLAGTMPSRIYSSKDMRISNSNSPSRSRKVSINETAETIGDVIDDMIYDTSDDDDKDSKSSDIPESIGNDI